MSNPLLALPFEASIESLGDSYWDVVEAASFPQTKLRFRNDALLRQLGVDPGDVTNHDVEMAYGRFEHRVPLLALRYHGYQFGTYNPQLGDGRGFLYGQLRDRTGMLQDLGSKGSGTTPWSRGGDGRLTLKGGVRELIASEALHRLGVTTSRTLSLIETGEELWRGDEPSPTRSSVMVRVAQTHLRFGTCERLLYLRDPQALERLLRHVVAVYYPDVASAHPAPDGDRVGLERQLLAFYGELVGRVARLAVPVALGKRGTTQRTELPPKKARLTPSSRALRTLSYMPRVQYSSCPTEINPFVLSKPCGSACVSTLEI